MILRQVMRKPDLANIKAAVKWDTSGRSLR